MRALAVVAGIALLATATSARSEVLCATKRGQLSVRESCRKRQHVVKPDMFIVPGPAGAKGGAGATGGPARFPLRLVDANDTEVGRIIKFDAAQAVVEIDDPDVASPVLMFIYPSGFAQEMNALVYVSDDCSGVPYKPAGYEGVGDDRPPVAQVWGLAAYYATGPLQDITYASEEQVTSTTCAGTSFPTGRGTCCTAKSGTVANREPSARIPMGDYGFLPPFRAVVR